MKRTTGFYFSIEHQLEGELTHFALRATCGRCGASMDPQGKPEMILPSMIKHSTECFIEAGRPHALQND